MRTFVGMIGKVLQISALDLKLEWRERQNYFAILLYVLSSIFLVYLSYKGIMPVETWNSFFWVLMIFASVQAAYRSFHYEADQRFLLYYGLVDPRILILGKTLYNFLYVLLIGLLNAFCFYFFFDQAIQDPEAFLLLIFLAALGFSSILTFVAGLSAKAGNNAALPAILSLPLLYPYLITLSPVSLRSLTGFDWTINSPYLLVLSMLALVGILLSYLLFPYLWRD